MSTLQLSGKQLIELADLVVERLADRIAAQHSPPAQSRLVDAHALAEMLGVSRDCVYRHAVELGGQRVAAGPRGRLRFDPTVALNRWQAKPADTPTPPRRRQPVAGPGHSMATIRLLPVRGEP